MIRKIIFNTGIIICLFSVTAHCQKNAVFGYIYDKESGEVLIGASITDKKSNKVSLSNDQGYFHMALADSMAAELEFSYLGYRSETKAIKPSGRGLSISLVTQNEVLKEVVVQGNAFRKNDLGKLGLSMSDIKRLPMLGGESDLLRAFQLLPGIQGGDEGSSVMLVRGGSHDQNLFLLDNIPLYYVNHLGGFMSVFDVDAINHAEIVKGAFPSQYGGRLSSIMNISMKNGNKYERKRKFSLGLIGSKLFMEGPLKDENTTYLFSARICNAGLLLKALNAVNSVGYDNGYDFIDFSGKITHRMDKNNSLSLSLYAGMDKLSFKLKESDEYRKVYSSGKDSHQWGNIMTNFRWFHQYNPNLISNTILAYTRFFNESINQYQSDYKGENLESKAKYSSVIDDVILKSDFQYFFKEDWQLKFGMDVTMHNFTPSSYRYQYSSSIEKNDTLINSKMQAYNADLYIGGDFQLTKTINFQPGIRLSNWFANDYSFTKPEPRIAISYTPAPKMKLSASYSYMTQYVHLLTNQSNTIPNDLWVPTTKKLPPETSDQYSLGMTYHLPLGFMFSIEGYYKTTKNLIEYEESLFSFRRINWQDGVTSGGNGKSKGLEFFLNKEEGKFNGWISYTLSKVTRQFDNLNHGKEYPYKFDHIHDLSIVCNFQLNKQVSFSVNWIFMGGNNITMPVEKYYIYKPAPFARRGQNHYDPDTGEYTHTTDLPPDKDLMVYNYNGKNGYKTPAYHRLDIGLNYESGNSVWNFGVYNVYNRQNAYYYYSDNGQWKKLSFFPVIPSFSYTYNY